MELITLFNYEFPITANEEDEEKGTKEENEEDLKEKPSVKISEEEIIEDLTDLEENIRNNILEDEALDSETLDHILIQWWKEEPFKYVLVVSMKKEINQLLFFKFYSLILLTELDTKCCRIFGDELQ